MKFSKLFTKIVAGTAMGIMLMSSAAMASPTTTTTTVTVPGYTYTQTYGYASPVPLVTPSMTAYSNMILKAQIFDPYQQVVVDQFLKTCIPAADLDKAITNAKKAANLFDDVVVYDTLNNSITSASGSSNAFTSGVGYMFRFSSVVSASQLDDALEKASIGGVNFNFETRSASSIDYVTSAWMSIKLDSLNTLIDLFFYDYGNGTTSRPALRDERVDYPRLIETDLSFTQAKKLLNNYADLLTALKNYYAQACNVTTETATTTDKTTKDKSTKNAVINAKDKTIKLNANFNLKAANVTATDNNGKGKDITSKITQTGKVDTSKKGTFKVTYYVTGENGVKVSKAVTYTVK